MVVKTSNFMVTCIVPSASLLKSTRIVGVIRGVHGDWAYKTLEAAHDDIIDLKLEEAGAETRVLMRIRSLRDVGFDRRWHRLSFEENFNVSIEKDATSFE
jgi:KaiC/GvpD/RAD55 family RecA-like ATPase